MLFSILLLLLVLDCLALILVVLLQAGKGGGLAAGFGGAGTGMEMMGSRQTATFLHNATRWLGGAFLVISFSISLLTVRGSRPQGLIETQLQQEQAAPQAPQAPGNLEDLLDGGSEPAQPPGEALPMPAEGDGSPAGETTQPSPQPR
jgi:preprotein translocase subunit SecG